MNIFLFTFFLMGLLVGQSHLHAKDVEALIQGNFREGITVDLREPSYSDGVLTTVQGGVITGPEIRIQAKKIIYTRKLIEGKPVFSIEAEGDLMVEFGEYIIIGKSLIYNFQEKTGTIYQGRTSMEPWLFGGGEFKLCSDGSYIIYDGYITTLENGNIDWRLTAESVNLQQNNYIRATNVRFLFLNIPFLWLPSLKANLNTFLDNPIRYTLGWGGRQGPRLGLSCEVLAFENWKIYARLDFLIRRGFGGGFETSYKSADKRQTFQTVNYIAHDTSDIDFHEQTRYRFQGIYHNLLPDDKMTIDISYDKLSDEEMPTDYDDRGLELDTAGRTQIEVRRQENHWIANLLTRVRLNNFQTIKQELPTLQASYMPFEIPRTGIISENQIKASYLNFVYAKNSHHVPDFNAVRIESSNRLYRPIALGPLTMTPEVGGNAIFYGNAKGKQPHWLIMGVFADELNTSLIRYYGNTKHVVTPYIRYEYYTFPTISPNEHYIFDIDDGLFRLNMLTFGFRHSLMAQDRRAFYADFYAHAFFDTKTIPTAIPWGYADFVYRPSPTLKHVLGSGWDFRHNELDHVNFRTEWTANEDFAVSAEFRHRSPFAWRKVDYTNFILDSFRTDESLRHSPLSDRRDTVLFHCFYRFHPTWAIEFESRHGWLREHEKGYNEFEVDLLGSLGAACRFKIGYQHKESDDRVALYMSMGLSPPNPKKVRSLIPFVQF